MNVSTVAPPLAQQLHNLPTQLTSFVGREQEVAQARQLLSGTRLLSLTGAGGVGKTRLALHVASQLARAETYPGGIWLVELAPLVDGAVVPGSVASALGIRGEAGRSVWTPWSTCSPTASSCCFSTTPSTWSPPVLNCRTDFCAAAHDCAFWPRVARRSACPGRRRGAFRRSACRRPMTAPRSMRSSSVKPCAPGRLLSAVRLLGAAHNLRLAIGLTRRSDDDRLTNALRTGLGELQFEAAWQRGHTTPLDDLLAELLPEGHVAEAPLPVATALLTRRETEVAALLARGLTNRQIGDALVIAEGTAEKHVANIMAKLDVTSRAQVAVWAAQHGLLPAP